MEFFLKLLCSRSYAFLLLVLFMLLARSGFTRSVFIFCLSCVWLNQIGVAALSVKIEALEKQVNADSVDRALVCVRQLAGRPVGLSDGTAIVAALESLADVSRSAGHVDFRRHEAILRQCRPLTHDPRLPAVVTQLLGDDESKKIAGQIQKILKSDHLFSAPQVHGSPFPASARAPSYLRQQGSGRGRSCSPGASPEAVSKLPVKASVRDLRFRNPVCFRAGNIHNFITRWEGVLTGQEKRAEILSYLRDGVDVNSFFAPYKGDFQGMFYDSPIPPSACFPNSKSCEEFTDFISSTISQRLANGSISVWGKVGECTPPYLVMPLTVEPTKPRLCHDERFLNLWVKDSPFTLDYISNLPRYVGKDSFQTTIDDKSGYDHVRLAENSRKFFGLQWQGVYYVYHTIPFGWKASAYIYHTIGMGATS